MARCIPEAVHESHRVRGEADFLHRLRTELSDEWMVLHSLNLGAAERAGEFEADFVLLHPRGRLTLELKGGAITCQEGDWHSRGAGGRFRIKPPFHQAKTNAHEVHEHLKRVFGPDSPEAGAPYTHAVVFPDCDFDAPSIEAPRDRTLDRAALAGPLEVVMIPLLAVAEAQLVARKPGSAVPAPLTPAQLAATLQALRPDLRLVPNLSAPEFDAHLARLSAEQLAVFQLIEGNPRLRVTGGAGTGKTLIALEACRRERAARPGARIGLVCFNRYLGQHLARQVEAEGLDDRIEAGSLFLHIDQLLGVEPLPAGSPHAAYAERAARAAEAAAALPDARRFDLLVVDEGQDMRATPDHLRILDGLLRGGFAAGRWRWLEDAGQALVYTPEPPAPHPAADAVAAALASAAAAHLRRNWRNTDNVADAFARVAGLPRDPASGFPGPSPSLARAAKGRELETLDALLARVVLAKHAPEEVVVLSLRGAGRECYAGRETLGGLRRAEFNPLLPAGRDEIRTATVAKFKGLESHAVVLVDIDRVENERDRRALYVGMSRAKYGLYLLGGPEAIQAIEAQLA
ncbi:MAG: NERD domain-containing protein [Opitutales bacterium]